MRRRLLAIHASAADFFHNQLLKKQSAQVARDYLKSRGISVEVARGWKLGYAPDSWDALTNWLREEEYTKDEVVVSGLGKLNDDGNSFYDRFRHRVMFPICNDQGEVIAFSGRTLDSELKGAKYVNSPETPLFKKGSVLFGIHRSKRALIEKESAIVCEGQLDLITAFESGVQNVIAPQGTAFTEQQARILGKLVKEVILCFDADKAGDNAAVKSLPWLLGENLGVRLVEMPSGEDPDSLIRGQGAEAFRQLVEQSRDFFDVQLDRLAKRQEFQTPQGRADLARQFGEWASHVKDPLMREMLSNKLSSRFEVSQQQFAKLIIKPEPRPSNPVSEEDAVLDAPIKKKLPKMDPTLHLLSLAALHNEDARAWLLEEEWREQLAHEPDAGLLIKILEADYQPGDTGSLQGFLTTFEPEEEAAISGLLGDKPPVHPLTVARDCWNELERRQIRRRVEAIKARMRAPGISVEEITTLQKEILDRQKRLLDIAPPLSPPL
ncbi:MAG: DNA primase [Verrucomicrobiaceae bacterium]|nr:MAG: DNA primase [Verrucomicrobiaceae bacterium]